MSPFPSLNPSSSSTPFPCELHMCLSVCLPPPPFPPLTFSDSHQSNLFHISPLRLPCSFLIKYGHSNRAPFFHLTRYHLTSFFIISPLTFSPLWMVSPDRIHSDSLNMIRKPFRGNTREGWSITTYSTAVIPAFPLHQRYMLVRVSVGSQCYSQIWKCFLSHVNLQDFVSPSATNPGWK